MSKSSRVHCLLESNVFKIWKKNLYHLPINSRPDHAQMTPSTYTNKHQPGTTRMSHNLKAQCPQPKAALYCRIQTDRQPSPPQDSNSMDDSTPFRTVWGPPPCRAPEKPTGYRESLWWETQRHCHWWRGQTQQAIQMASQTVYKFTELYNPQVCVAY